MRRLPVATPRLVLRKARRGDAAALEFAIDDVVVAAQGWSPYVRAAYLKAFESWWTRRAGLIACDRETAEVLGAVTLHGPTRAPKLGISLGPNGRGRGLGFEAIDGTLSFLRAARVRRATVETAESNMPMRRIAEATGFGVAARYVHQLPNGAHVWALRYTQDLRARPHPGPARQSSHDDEVQDPVA